MVLGARFKSMSLKLLNPCSSHYAMLPSKGVDESWSHWDFWTKHGLLYASVFFCLKQASPHLSSLHTALLSSSRRVRDNEWAPFCKMPWFLWRKAARKCEVWWWWPFQGWVMSGNFLTFQVTTSERKWNFPEAQAGDLTSYWFGVCISHLTQWLIWKEAACMLGFHLVSLKAYGFWFIFALFVQGCFIAKGWMTGFPAGCKDR